MKFSIVDYGAVGDGKTLNTRAIQAAIDACAAAGGGSVVIAGGRYLTGTVILRSRVNLHLEADGVLLGSPECADFPERADVKHVSSPDLPRNRNACMIYAEECTDVSITGLGIIDCNGHHFVRQKTDGYGWPYERIDAPTPPRVVFFTGCRNVKIEDITMTNQPAGWSYWIHDCDYVTFDKLKILANVLYPNNDGIHINASRNVTVSNCSITTGDDCLVVRANNRSLPENKVCERVTITNCNLTSYSGGIRIAWLNDGTIRNCVFSNLVMTNTSVGIDVYLPQRPENEIWADQGREATLVENLLFQNIVMDGIYGTPIRCLIGQSEETRCEAIRNLRFSNIHAKGLEFPSFCGREENKIQNITLSGCRFEKVPDTVLPDYKTHGAAAWDRPQNNRLFTHVENIMLNDTSFTAL